MAKSSAKVKGGGGEFDAVKILHCTNLGRLITLC